MNKRSTVIIIGSTLALMILSIGVFMLVITKNSSDVPKEISSQAASAIFISKGKGVSIDRATYKYDPSLKQFSYVVSLDTRKIVVSQQPSPEVFADVPEYFPRWITSTGEYTSFYSKSGKVHLARNKSYGASSVAIMNEKGTLLFAKPLNGAQLTDDEWKRLFLTIKLQ